jgi:hypothetical protein
MAAEIVPQIRQRINVTQTAKGLHQIECTFESIERAQTDANVIAEQTLKLIKAVETKLKEDGRKLVTEEHS